MLKINMKTVKKKLCNTSGIQYRNVRNCYDVTLNMILQHPKTYTKSEGEKKRKKRGRK